MCGDTEYVGLARLVNLAGWLDKLDMDISPLLDRLEIELDILDMLLEDILLTEAGLTSMIVTSSGGGLGSPLLILPL